MIAPLHTVTVELPAPDKCEICRYAGSSLSDGLPIEECLSQLGALDPRVTYCEFPLTIGEKELDLGFAVTDSTDLRKNLKGCDRILLFAATVGRSPDRLIARYNRVSPVKALICQAIGSERVEALCDAFFRQMTKEYENRGETLRPRFSPGYGDLPLTLQRDIFAVLDCPRQLGITLNDSLLMTPTKSVTALIGIKKS